MKHIYLLLMALCSTVFSFAQINVAASIGTTTASYTTLKEAFDAINAGTYKGIITITVAGNTTETAAAILNEGGSALAKTNSIHPLDQAQHLE